MIKREYIVIDLDLKNKNEVLDFIGKKALECGITDDIKTLISDLKDREKQFSTDIGIGISIPHTKSDAVKKTSVLFLRYKNSINWNGLSDKQASGDENSGVMGSIVFLTPKNDEDNVHLKILSRISRQLMHKDFLDMLFNESNSENIYKGINQIIEI